MFAEARAVGRQNLRGHLQCHASKGQESNLGHRPSCPIRKHCKPALVDPSQGKACRGSQQSLCVASKGLTHHLSLLGATLTKNCGGTQIRFDGAWLELIATAEDSDRVGKGPSCI